MLAQVQYSQAQVSIIHELCFFFGAYKQFINVEAHHSSTTQQNTLPPHQDIPLPPVILYPHQKRYRKYFIKLWAYMSGIMTYLYIWSIAHSLTHHKYTE